MRNSKKGTLPCSNGMRRTLHTCLALNTKSTISSTSEGASRQSKPLRLCAPQQTTKIQAQAMIAQPYTTWPDLIVLWPSQ